VERREGAPPDGTGLRVIAVERGRCKERKTAAPLEQWRGALNERDETQGAGIRMEEGQRVLGGREKSRVAGGSRRKVKGKDSNREGRDKGICASWGRTRGKQNKGGSESGRRTCLCW